MRFEVVLETEPGHFLGETCVLGHVLETRKSVVAYCDFRSFWKMVFCALVEDLHCWYVSRTWNSTATGCGSRSLLKLKLAACLFETVIFSGIRELSLNSRSLRFEVIGRLGSNPDWPIRFRSRLSDWASIQIERSASDPDWPIVFRSRLTDCVQIRIDWLGSNPDWPMRFRSRLTD